jgi:hypothetical protein
MTEQNLTIIKTERRLSITATFTDSSEDNITASLQLAKYAVKDEPEGTTATINVKILTPKKS